MCTPKPMVDFRKHNSAALYLNPACGAAKILEEDYVSFMFSWRDGCTRQATVVAILHEKHHKCAPISWIFKDVAAAVEAWGRWREGKTNLYDTLDITFCSIADV